MFLKGMCAEITVVFMVIGFIMFVDRHYHRFP